MNKRSRFDDRILFKFKLRVVFTCLSMKTLKNPSTIESQRYSLSLARGKSFQRPLGVTLTDLLSKLVCSETKEKVEAEIKRNDLNCH